MHPHAPHAPLRWLSWLAPPLVLVVLVIVGRRVEVSDAAASPAPSASLGVVDAGAATVTDAVALDTSALEAMPDVTPEVARPIELLADGAVIVDLNLASEDELRKLPGIGPGRARRILELRARLGRLKSADDLARIKGFGRALLKRLRPLVRTS